MDEYLFFGSFLLPSKEMNSHMKCEKLSRALARTQKMNPPGRREPPAVRQHITINHLSAKLRLSSSLSTGNNH
jgi:hypothetical protein